MEYVPINIKQEVEAPVSSDANQKNESPSKSNSNSSGSSSNQVAADSAENKVSNRSYSLHPVTLIKSLILLPTATSGR